MKKVLFFLLFFIIPFSFYAQNSFKQEGKASYYSDKMHGRRTTSGERYNKNALTAAHATLPLGTIVLITNIKNNKTVSVKINDRCSKHSTRIIDVSKAAAKELDMIRDGMIRVIIEVVPVGEIPNLPPIVMPKDSLMNSEETQN